MEDYKKLLIDLYSIYDPERVKQIDYFLEKYKGQEKQFYTRQKENYENKKPVSDSKKIIEEALARIKARSTESATDKEPKEEVKAKPEESVDMPKEKKEFSTPEPIVDADFVASKPVIESAFIPPKASVEDTFIAPPVENTIKRKPFKISSEDFDDKPLRKPLFEEEDKFGARKKTTPPFSEASKPAQEDVWFSNDKSESTPNPIDLEPESVALPKKKYFLNIFGMVLLGVILISIVFFTFFNAPEKQAVGIVKKPSVTPTEKTVDASPKETSIPIESKKEIVEETKVPKKTFLEKLKSAFIKKEPVVANTNTSKSFEEEKALFDKSIQPDINKTGDKPDIEITEKVKETAAEKIVIPVTKIIEEEKAPAQKTPELKTVPISKNEPISNFKGARINKNDLNLPVYFVACYAVKTESYALTKVNQLKAKGFDASYYWIPDFAPYGNKYFKVVIGPFSTQREAMRKLTPVQERAEFDAYVLQLK